MKLANGQPIYPDANSTLRLTYGQVLPYAPADGVKYDYYTTLKGAMEKEDPDNWEFVVPAKLKQLYQARISDVMPCRTAKCPSASLSTQTIPVETPAAQCSMPKEN